MSDDDVSTILNKEPNHEEIIKQLNTGYEKHQNIRVKGDTMYVIGTHNISDVALDVTLPFAGPEWSQRYREVVKTYHDNRMRIKYIVGHSLGANLVSHLNKNSSFVRKHTKVITYNNPYVGIEYSNQEDYSNRGDVLTIFNRYAQMSSLNPNPYAAHFEYMNRN